MRSSHLSPYVISIMKSRMRWVGHVAHLVHQKYTELQFETLKMRPHRIPRYRGEDNIKTELRM
jgi:hypothetical protein